jgi:hypothetical protein
MANSSVLPPFAKALVTQLAAPFHRRVRSGDADDLQYAENITTSP